VVRGFYLADSEATAWGEWYRHTSEQGAPPASRMPRDTWRIAVDVRDIADLTELGVLDRHGIAELRPTRRQWPLTQPVGESCFADGWRGLLAPSAAHEGGKVLVIFRPLPALPG
jgi:RES domain-containing protein